MMDIKTLIIRNLQNKRYQYVIIGILFAILNISILTSTYLSKGLTSGIETAKDKLGADIILTSKDDDNKTIESIYDGIPTSSLLNIKYDDICKIQGVDKYCKRLYLATLEGASCCDNKIQLIAIDNDDYLLKTLTNELIGSGYIIIGNNVSGEIGQTITYYGKDFIVKDVLTKTGTGYDYSGFITYEDANVIIKDNPDKLSKYKENDISTVFISSDNPALTRNVLNNRFGKDASIYLTDNKIAEYTKTVFGVKTVMKWITCLLIISSMLAIATIMTLMFINRRNEVGIYILSGLNKNAIHKLFLAEIVITIMISMMFSTIIFYIMSGINKTYYESLLHCPIGTVNSSITVLLMFLCCIIFADVIIRAILTSFLKKDACTLLKEVN